MKKLISLLITTILLLSLIPATALADDSAFTGVTYDITAKNFIDVTLNGQANQVIQGSNGFVYTLSTLPPEKNNGAKYLGIVEEQRSGSDSKSPLAVFLVEDHGTNKYSASVSCFGFSVNKPSTIKLSGAELSFDGFAGGYGSNVFNKNFKLIDGIHSDEPGSDPVDVKANETVYISFANAYSGESMSKNAIGSTSVTVFSGDNAIDTIGFTIMVLTENYAKEILAKSNPDIFKAEGFDDFTTYNNLSSLLNKAGLGSAPTTGLDNASNTNSGNTPPITQEAVTAMKTASKVTVDGTVKSFDAYTINGNNYFKLRDIAYILSGTEKQFEVTWDGAKNAINLVGGSSYTTVGGEMAVATGSNTKSATLSTSKIYLDGKEISLTAYTISGNNYFKLRDLGSTFDFGVAWDGKNNTVAITSTTGYVPEVGSSK